MTRALSQLTVVGLFVIIAFWSCKSWEAAEEITNNNIEKKEALSPDDMMQTFAFSEIGMDDRVYTGQLANGLTYYLMPNKKPENRAELRLVVKAGSVDEDYDQLGVAHFVEHMAFNGTKHFSKNELVEYLESVGTRFGADLNAYTSFEETVYMLQVRTDVEEQLKKGLLVLSDWASGLTFDEEEVDKERGVVISEWRTRLSAAQRMQQEYLPVLLRGSRYANRLPIGDPDVIKNADYETIRKFYYEWYRPDLMAVVVVGDFSPALMEDYINQYFADVPKAVAPKPKKEFQIGSHDKTLVKVCTDPEAPMTQVRIINKLPPTRMTDVGDFKDRMVSRLFVQMMNARLAELTQKVDAPYLFASCYKGPDIGPMDTYSTFAACKDDEVLTALEVVVRENVRVRQHGFTQAELDRAKAVVLKSAESVLKEKDKTASSRLAGRYVQHFLKGTAYFSPEDYHSLVNKYVPDMPLDIVNENTSWFQDSNRVVIVTAPEREDVKLPNNRQILEMIEKVSAMEFEPYFETVVDAPLLDFTPDMPKIVSHTVDSTVGVETFVLGNDARVMFKATEFNNDQILFKAVTKGGQSTVVDDDFVSASHAAWIIRESGVGAYSNIELEKKLSGKKVSVRPFLESRSHGLVGSSGVEETEILGQLIYLFFTDLREDSVTFVAFKDRMSAYYNKLLSDPSYYFSNEISRIVTRGNFRRMFPTSLDMDDLDMESVYRVFGEMLSDPSKYTFIFTGNLSLESQNALLAYIGSIPSGDGWDSDHMEEWHVPAPDRFVWSRGQAPKTYVEVRYYHQLDTLTQNMKDDLGALKSLLDIKLREELREDRSGVYGVRSFLSSNFLPENTYMFGFGFTAEPTMADTLIQAAKKVFKVLIEQGPDVEDIEKVKEIERRQFEKDVMTNDFWLRSMDDFVLKDLELQRATTAGLEARLERLTSDHLRRLLEDLVTSSNVVTFIQNPEE